MSVTRSSVDTIYALSSGALPSGVAVIRLSGPHCRFALETMGATIPTPRKASLRRLYRVSDQTLLDEALILFFEGPASFTGEDVLELHCHGGRAVVDAVLRELSRIDGLRIAEPGEFTKRAFYEDRINLVAVEGLSDLIKAETESQRQLALYQTSGELAEIYDGWRTELIRLRSYLEAEFDFADEGDVPGSVSDHAWARLDELIDEMEDALSRSKCAERIRDGVKVVIAGRPNVGKSSLLNVLANREVAIVSAHAGTTRDLLDVRLDLAGVAVTLTDTAGLRDTDDEVERIGVGRARQGISHADLIIYVVDLCDFDETVFNELESLQCVDSEVVVIGSKLDQVEEKSINSIRDRFDLLLSNKTKSGIDSLIAVLTSKVGLLTGKGEHQIAVRERHRLALVGCVQSLNSAKRRDLDLELRAEELRRASNFLGLVTGRIDVENMLDVIFKDFCIGK